VLKRLFANAATQQPCSAAFGAFVMPTSNVRKLQFETAFFAERPKLLESLHELTAQKSEKFHLRENGIC